ncbi:Endonuclease III-like protein 1 [Babesia sp. Xinjiang]|uniref:Endonuclease III-like protein 1 n=1 Tax=Babesia sp. Xinjiang TaxID=462227 RepID=UPI000A241806|nr:Endonuclease III-like protein 1 [Babesia sp. Xinjiang]ORM41130.1 Endonuclease III-like protein 1 [Babesia sp. Xinjiang]
MVQTWRRPWWKLLALAFCSFKSLIRGVKTLCYTVNRSYAWITPRGVRIRISQVDTLLEDSMVKRSRNDIPEALTGDESVKRHLEDLLDSKIELEALVKNMIQEENSTSPQQPSPEQSTSATTNLTTDSEIKPISNKKSAAKKLKISYDNEYIDLDYDTKRQPFRHIEQNECKIPNFANVWNAIVDMRQSKTAPVDTMGAHCCADETEDKATYEYQTLIACMLSSQTKDAVTAAAMDALKQRGLNVQNIAKMSEEELDSLISKVGFHKTKAKHIKQATDIILNEYNGRVPDTVQDLVALPGVGPKMANLVMQLAFKRINGIAVDLHVHRIANRLGWVKTKTPEETRIKLQSLIPQKLWAEVNHLLVGFGQTICVAAGPGCPTCAANTWCPTGRAYLAK